MANSATDWFDGAVAVKPKRLVAETPAWNGHIPFGTWLVAASEPRVLVELGTHLGNSYFSFCQTIRENGQSTRAFAVDTWAGDAHAGRYSSWVFDDVDGYNRNNYNDFSTLLKMTFDEALPQFQDGTVDLLHIDGLHTYEAVKHDFDTWLPKVSSRGIVLFHDISVHENGFAVWKLWDELKQRYRNCEFSHSYGLGVLFVGPEQTPAVERFIAENEAGNGKPVDVFAQIGGFYSEVAHLKQRVSKMDKSKTERIFRFLTERFGR